VIVKENRLYEKKAYEITVAVVVDFVFLSYTMQCTVSVAASGDDY